MPIPWSRRASVPSSSAFEAARAAAQRRLDTLASGAQPGGVGPAVGRVLVVLPARCVPLDHAAIAWAHASGLPAPTDPAALGTELAVTTTGLAYLTSPVPYVWWRRWEDVRCRRAVVGRRRWRQRTVSVFVADRAAPFEGRAVELPAGAATALMDAAVERGAVDAPLPDVP